MRSGSSSPASSGISSKPGGHGAGRCETAENDREDAMAVSTDSKTRTPEAQLRSYINRFDPKDQKLIRSVRAAVRKRFPTANELVYDYSSHVVISYSPTEQAIDAIVAIAARAAERSIPAVGAWPRRRRL
jgi:hypothetical protein